MRLFRHWRPALAAGLLSCLAVAGEPAAAAVGGLEAFRAIWVPFLGRFHPVVLHLPIGIMFALACVEFLLLFRRNQPMQGAAVVLCTLGFFTSCLAAVLGYCLYLEGGYSGEDMKWHMYTGYAVAGSAFLVWIWRLISLDPEHGGRRFFYRLLLLGNLGIMGVAGHFGGNITHGSDFLTEHMPDDLRARLAKLGWHEGGKPADASTNAVASAETFYAAVIQPLFEARCVSCHGESKQKGEYRLDTPEHLLKAGESEKTPVVPGKPAESYLVELIRHGEDHEDVMPPEGKPRLSPEHIALITWWVEQAGASTTLLLSEAKIPVAWQATAAAAKTLKKDAGKKTSTPEPPPEPTPAPAAEKAPEPKPEAPTSPAPAPVAEKAPEPKAAAPAPVEEKAPEPKVDPAPSEPEPAPVVEKAPEPKVEPAPAPAEPAPEEGAKAVPADPR